ncbi:MAG: SatD family protein [Acidobacteriaceae bacterium]
MSGHPKPRTQPHIAVIGDMLDSRAASGSRRMRIQKRFNQFIGGLNRSAHYGPALRSRFAITLGDEFQGILNNASVLPDLIWDVTNATDLPAFRLGIGYGTIDTEIPPYAINLDGPALHHARTAIDIAKKEGFLGGVFVGFGEEIDVAANGVARLLWFQMHKRTPAQLRVLGLLREGRTQVEIARRLRRKPQVINKQKIAAGWEAFHAGEQALCAILRLGTAAPGK